MMKNVPRESRGAQFRCVVAILGQDLEDFTEGIIRGVIGRVMSGSAGFGYDPLFIPEGYEQTFAELGSELKNHLSHRALAFRAAREVIEKYIL